MANIKTLSLNKSARPFKYIEKHSHLLENSTHLCNIKSVYFYS